jgi:hypothetical protein
MAPVILHIAYPAGASFNTDYYINKHLPPAIEGWKALGGLVGYKLLTPLGEGSPYDAVLQATWESPEALANMQAKVSPEQQKALADDVPNFSTKMPSIWVSEIKASL